MIIFEWFEDWNPESKGQEELVKAMGDLSGCGEREREKCEKAPHASAGAADGCGEPRYEECQG